jgi:hypothetical protein
MTQYVLCPTYLFAISAVFALLEVQIEGNDGWARQLPTGRIENAWTQRRLGARAITGYHCYIHTFVLLLAHSRVSRAVLGAEDFLWFAVNPSFGLSNFRRERVWWHAQTSWGFMPRDYLDFYPAGPRALLAEPQCVMCYAQTSCAPTEKKDPCQNFKASITTKSMRCSPKKNAWCVTPCVNGWMTICCPSLSTPTSSGSSRNS